MPIPAAYATAHAAWEASQEHYDPCPLGGDTERWYKCHGHGSPHLFSLQLPLLLQFRGPVNWCEDHNVMARRTYDCTCDDIEGKTL